VFDPTVLKLVAITDDVRDGRDGLVARARAAARGGATMIQVRLKDADARTQVEVARALVHALPVPVLVNDRVDVALAAGAAGVHVGADDLPVAAVRRITPPAFIVGASVGCDAEVDGARGADYVGIGPVFSSRPGDASVLGTARLASLVERCGLPVVAIGGITADTAPAAISAGACGVAVLSAIFAAADPERATRAIRSAIGT